MAPSLHWIPEAYPRSGGLAAAGFYKLLGRPRLDPLTVLVRETAQNSWDARSSDSKPVVFTISGRSMGDDERAVLAERIFPKSHLAAGTGLASALAKPGMLAIYITDRNTKGLGGPVHADEADPTETYDWVDFVLNVGKANTSGHTGGTYGFGKTISYVVSNANSVVIHSRARCNGRIETRLMACAIGEEFTLERRLWTGRHWWGVKVGRGEPPAPLTGAAADELARQIGMPPFAPEELGTNLLIVDPDLGGRSLAQAMSFISESVLWHLWPKLHAGNGEGQMDIRIDMNGEPVQVPDPADRPPLQGFVQAYRALNDGVDAAGIPGATVVPVECQRPKTTVGDLAIVPLVQRPRPMVDDGFDPNDADSPQPAAAIRGGSHHVALLRSPELVVDYLEGPSASDAGLEWAAVFRCRREHDGKFASSEPPTHDSWAPELLPKGPDRTVVNVGLRRIRECLEERWATVPTGEEMISSSTALIADDLAHLVRTEVGAGRGRSPRKTSSSTATISPRVEVVHAGPIEWQGHAATEVRFRLTPVKGTDSTEVTVSIGAALDGSESDPDLDPDLSLIGITRGAELVPMSGHDASITFTGSGQVEFAVLARRSRTTSVLVDVNATVGAAE